MYLPRSHFCSRDLGDERTFYLYAPTILRYIHYNALFVHDKRLSDKKVVRSYLSLRVKVLCKFSAQREIRTHGSFFGEIVSLSLHKTKHQ